MSTRPLPNSGQLNLSLANERRVYGVSELNATVGSLFESEFRGIWVAGEISGCRLAPSGHFYFSLKDEASQVKCALFKGAARFARFKPQEGLAVIARGSLEVYQARGEYQLIVEMLEPQGAGALQLAFEQLKKKLAAEGLFDPARKRPLPKLPRRIGIVTSPGGAVISDILHVLERRFPGLHIRLYPAQVQGEGSVAQVCAGIAHFSRSAWADVLIVARGGGSLEDLWTFNEEAVARALAASSIPVISAVGHETDFTIADFVADFRAPTPSAAAEVVVCTRDSLFEQIQTCRTKALQALRYRLLMASKELEQRGASRAVNSLGRALNKRAQRCDDLDFRLRRQETRLLELHQKRLADLRGRLAATDLRLRFARNRHRQALLGEALGKAAHAYFWHAKRRFESTLAHLTQLSPLSVLARGYAIVENQSAHVVRSASEVAVGESLRLRLSQGELETVVASVRKGSSK